MTDLVNRHLFREDFTVEKGWRLIEWCLAHGATDFTVGGIVCENSSDEPLKPFDRAASTHKLPDARRRDLDPEIKSRELWELNSETVAALHLAFPIGVFDCFIKDFAWFEDLTIYRNGEVMLGIISHEGEGVIRLSGPEIDQLHADGFVTRVAGE
jgi:hypothetical protein